MTHSKPGTRCARPCSSSQLFVLPQFLLCGLLVPRDQLPTALNLISDALPLSHAIDAMRSITTSAQPAADVGHDLAIVLGFVVGSVVLGSATLRPRTP